MILLVDNYDSFTWNLYQSMAGQGAQVEVRRNDAITLDEVAALQPLDFTRLPIIALAAWLLFGEVAGAEVWLGAAVVFGSGLYISYREAQLRRMRQSGRTRTHER